MAYFLTLILVVLFSPLALWAGDFTLFGPSLYERQEGKPVSQTTVFPSQTPGPGYILEVLNGDDKGHRVSSAAIVLNDIEVIGPSNLNKQVSGLSRAVSLTSSNELSVTLAGAPGSFLIISIKSDSKGPQVSLEADPIVILQGDPATLSWTSTEAETATIDNGIGPVTPTGAVVVTPTATTTYTITVTGPGGSATASATVTVGPALPKVTIEVLPASIYVGESAMLSWTTDAETATIDNGIGPVALTGSMVVMPSTTTTYTITATGPSGSATASTTIIVTPPPSTLTGVVSNEVTGEPLENATVAVLHTRDVDMSPDDYDFGEWGPADFEAVRANDDIKAVSADTASKIFKVRNPFGTPDPIRIAWNGLGCDSRDQVLAQSFTAAATGLLTKVSLKLARESWSYDLTEGTVRVFLKTQAGGEKEDILAESSSMKVRDLATAGTWVDFTFPDPMALSRGETYVLELATSAHGSGHLLDVYWRYQTPNPYHGGQGFQREDGLWQAVSGSFAFRTYVDDRVDQEQTSESASLINLGLVTQRVSLYAYNQERGGWDTLQSAGHEPGYDDVTLEALLVDDPAAYYDADGWVSVKVTYLDYMQYPVPIVVTDFFSVEFPASYHCTTDANGLYVIDGMQAGRYAATADKAGYYTEDATGAMVSGETHRQDFQLQPAPALAIAITSPLQGETVRDWPLAVTGTVTNDAEVTINGVDTYRSGDNFSVTLYPDGGEYLVTATALDQFGQVETATAGVLLEMGQVTGVVTAAATGMPVSGAEVRVRIASGGAVYRTVTTQADGTYLLRGVTAGPYYISISGYGYILTSTSGEIASGQTLTFDAALRHTAPELYYIAASGITTDSATITWTTYQPADSRVDFGPTSTYGSSAVDSTLATSHSLTLTGLEPGTEYHFMVTSTNSDGNSRSSADMVFQTEASAFQPTISGIAVKDITGTSATITWVTDLLADSLAEYGISTAYGSSAADPALTANHSLTVTGLEPGAEYHFRVSSTTSEGGSRSSADTVFQTEAQPVISAIAVVDVTGSSATITWTTNQPATGMVEFGETSGYGQVVADSALATSHSLTLTGLYSGKTYHFRVSSTNGFDLSTASEDRTFTTLTLFSVQILSPAAGEVVTRPDVMVHGLASSHAGGEIGVVVNGSLTLSHGDEFAANHVALTEGENTITVMATDTAGNRAQATVAVTFAPGPGYVTLSADDTSTLAPLETTLRAEATFALAGPPVFSGYGPGAVTYTETGVPENVQVSMTAPGLYFYTVEVQDLQGNTFGDTVAVLALDRTELDALLRAKWDGMKEALLGGSIQDALDFFYIERKSSYGIVLQELSSQISSIISDTSDIDLVEVVDGKARYVVDYEIMADGSPITASSYVIFIIDTDGLWKVIFF